MAGRKLPPFLKMVETVPTSKPVDQGDFRIAPWQQTLFATPLPNLLLFVHFETISESDFLAAMVNARPKYVIDLRVAPRFDLGTLNRRLVFSVFHQVGAQYYDLLGKLGIRSTSDAALNPALLVGRLRQTVFRDSERIEGPIAFLVSDRQADVAYEASMAQNMDGLSEIGWELLRVPHAPPERAGRATRDTVFISHAFPEDNDFARWLSARLSSLGYKVWSDVTRLIGGEEFWNDIETTIREHSSKVVVCLSRPAQSKNGVLDEVACAVGVERSRGLENFVIPVRLDDLPFDEVRANIGRKNIIDFSGGWTKGLSELVRAFDRDGVPRPVEDGPSALSLVASLQKKATSTLIQRPEQTFANWFDIISLPDAITFVEFDGPIHDEKALRRLIPRPTFGYLRLIGSFSQPDEIQGYVPDTVRISHRCTIPVSEFLRGKSIELPGLSAKDARNQLSSLLRQGWDRRAEALGLLCYQTAHKSNAWYAPKGLIVGDVVRFLGPERVKRRKSLLGRSEKRNVYWHFAIEAVPNLGNPWHFTFRPHVVFSEDGRTPIQSAARMHALRRGFCKSWWNDRWRDLIAAFAAWIAQGEEHISIPMSKTENVEVNQRMMEFTSSISLTLPEHALSVQSAADVEPDWADDPELDDTELGHDGNSAAGGDETEISDDDR